MIWQQLSLNYPLHSRRACKVPSASPNTRHIRLILNKIACRALRHLCLCVQSKEEREDRQKASMRREAPPPLKKWRLGRSFLHPSPCLTLASARSNTKKENPLGYTLWTRRRLMEKTWQGWNLQVQLTCQRHLITPTKYYIKALFLSNMVMLTLLVVKTYPFLRMHQPHVF